MLKRMMIIGLITMTLVNVVGCGNTNQEEIKEDASKLVEEYK
jgi:hypothetical protein